MEAVLLGVFTPFMLALFVCVVNLERRSSRTEIMLRFLLETSGISADTVIKSGRNNKSDI